jgi:hypothetical protein
MYYLDAPGHLPPSKHDLNRMIREDIYIQYIQVTWTEPPRDLNPKMTFYFELLMELRDSLIVRIEYTQKLWMHNLRIP